MEYIYLAFQPGFTYWSHFPTYET